MRITKEIFSAILVASVTHPLTADSLSQRDRQHLVAHFQMTASWLPDEVASLSEAQLNYRSAPGRWTIAEVVQHLVIAEPNYWKLLQDNMNRPPQTSKQKASDADVLWYGIDRTQHEKTPAQQDPQGQPVNVSEALSAYTKLHSRMLEYAAKTTEDLRGHFVPDWGVDAYQCLLEISTHEQRHILQIREIKADPGFPKIGLPLRRRN